VEDDQQGVAVVGTDVRGNNDDSHNIDAEVDIGSDCGSGGGAEWVVAVAAPEISLREDFSLEFPVLVVAGC
jgi:hypothetical protein